MHIVLKWLLLAFIQTVNLYFGISRSITQLYNDDANKSSKIRINLNIAVDKSLTLSFKGMVNWQLFPQPTPVEARWHAYKVASSETHGWLRVWWREERCIINRGFPTMIKLQIEYFKKKTSFKIFPCNLMKTTAMVNKNCKCMYVDHHV